MTIYYEKGLKKILEILKRRFRDHKTLEELYGAFRISKMVFMYDTPYQFLLEFLQNAIDARAHTFLVILTPQHDVIIINDGKEFTSDDVDVISGVAISKKDPSRGYIGYIGIGVKSAFLLTTTLEIHSGQFHLKFSKNFWDKLIESPDWIEHSSEIGLLQSYDNALPKKIENIMRELSHRQRELPWGLIPLPIVHCYKNKQCIKEEITEILKKILLKLSEIMNTLNNERKKLINIVLNKIKKIMKTKKLTIFILRDVNNEVLEKLSMKSFPIIESDKEIQKTNVTIIDSRVLLFIPPTVKLKDDRYERTFTIIFIDIRSNENILLRYVERLIESLESSKDVLLSDNPKETNENMKRYYNEITKKKIKLRHIEINLMKNPKVKYEEKKWIVFYSYVNIPEEYRKDELVRLFRRDRCKTRMISIAIGMNKRNEIYPERGAVKFGVFSFLPLKEISPGFNFIIHTDFITEPGRVQIYRKLKWNEFLRDQLCLLLKDIIHEINREFGPQVLRIMKTKDIDDIFFSKFHETIREIVDSGKILLTAYDGTLVDAKKLVFLPPLFYEKMKKMRLLEKILQKKYNELKIASKEVSKEIWENWEREPINYKNFVLNILRGDIRLIFDALSDLNVIGAFIQNKEDLIEFYRDLFFVLTEITKEYRNKYREFDELLRVLCKILLPTELYSEELNEQPLGKLFKPMYYCIVSKEYDGYNNPLWIISWKELEDILKFLFKTKKDDKMLKVIFKLIKDKKRDLKKELSQYIVNNELLKPLKRFLESINYTIRCEHYPYSLPFSIKDYGVIFVEDNIEKIANILYGQLQEILKERIINALKRDIKKVIDKFNKEKIIQNRAKLFAKLLYLISYIKDLGENIDSIIEEMNIDKLKIDTILFAPERIESTWKINKLERIQLSIKDEKMKKILSPACKEWYTTFEKIILYAFKFMEDKFLRDLSEKIKRRSPRFLPKEYVETLENTDLINDYALFEKLGFKQEISKEAKELLGWILATITLIKIYPELKSAATVAYNVPDPRHNARYDIVFYDVRDHKSIYVEVKVRESLEIELTQRQIKKPDDFIVIVKGLPNLENTKIYLIPGNKLIEAFERHFKTIKIDLKDFIDDIKEKIIDANEILELPKKSKLK